MKSTSLEILASSFLFKTWTGKSTHVFKHTWTLEFKFTSTQEWEQKNKRSKNKRTIYEGGGDDNES